MGNPQIFREMTGEKRLLLAVIGQKNAVYTASSADGPWVSAKTNGVDYNNPTLVPRLDGSVVLYCHDCAHDPVGYGDSAMGVLGKPAAGGGYQWQEWAAPAGVQDGDPTRQGQLFIHPMEDPFAWWDAASKRFRMLTHTFRMGMVCGAGTTVPCGGGAELLGGEPMGALASSGGEHPFANWTYHEDMLAYNCEPRPFTPAEPFQRPDSSWCAQGVCQSSAVRAR